MSLAGPPPRTRIAQASFHCLRISAKPTGNSLTSHLPSTRMVPLYDAAYATVDATMFHPLRCQDHATLMAFGTGDRAGRVAVSVRDLARFGLLYLNRGTWGGRSLLRRQRI